MLSFMALAERLTSYEATLPPEPLSGAVQVSLMAVQSKDMTERLLIAPGVGDTVSVGEGVGDTVADGVADSVAVGVGVYGQHVNVGEADTLGVGVGVLVGDALGVGVGPHCGHPGAKFAVMIFTYPSWW